MADHEDVTLAGTAAGEVPLGLAMDFADTRGQVASKYSRLRRCASAGHGFRHAMGGEHDVTSLRHLVQLLDEHGTLRLEILDHGAVMHDFMADIDGRAIAAQRLLDDSDRPVDAGAEAAGAGEDDA